MRMEQASADHNQQMTVQKQRRRQAKQRWQYDPSGPEKGLYDTPLSHRIAMLTAVCVPLVGVVVAIVTLWQAGWMGWPFLAMLIGGWILTAMGITVGFHRLLTHNSFATYRPLRAFWMAMGALAVEGSPLIWCAVHRRHHEKSDHQGDPHSPLLHGSSWLGMLKGLWHAHTGWLFTHYWSRPNLQRYVPDLVNDRLLASIDKLYYVWVLVSLAIPTALGGLMTQSWYGAWMGLLWGGVVRIFVTHHITWSINSICHVYGKRHFHTTDNSRNNVICGLLALGEGWHNNHHAFPTSARHGLLWWQFDFSWLVIRLMERLGLAWDVVLPSDRVLAKRRI